MQIPIEMSWLHKIGVCMAFATQKGHVDIYLLKEVDKNTYARGWSMCPIGFYNSKKALQKNKF